MVKRLLLLLFAFAVVALGADPVIGTVTIKPTFAPANTPTQVTITALITDPTLIANGANVQRLNSSGNPTAVLGILHDDGLNGDMLAGDHIYTLVFTLNEPTPGRIFFRTSGAFQGVVQRVASSGVAVDIANAASPLSIDAATAPAPNAAGWNKQDVTVTFSCAGGAGGSDSCPGIVRVTSEGKGQTVPGTAADGSGNTATKSVAISLDKTAPILNITFPVNGATVNTPSLTLTGTVTDAFSGVASFTCNGQSASLNGSDFSCNLLLVPGSNAIAVQATDVAGNTTTSSLNVTYGISTLTITASPGPVPNTAGWNNTDVTVAFSCSGGAAPVNCPPTVVISTESGSQIISRTATDALGSTATASVALKIDKTRPILTITAQAAAATVTTPQITITGTATDTLSGIAKVTCNNVTAVLNGPNFSCNLTLVNGPNAITVQAIDVAGNTAASNLSVTLGTALTISASSSPAPNAAGWNRSNVTVTFTCAGGTGNVTCLQPAVASGEGANQVISRTATDSVGNSATASVTFNIDKTPPAVAINSPASGATVTTHQVTVTGTVTDTLSGIAAATCNGSPGSLTQSSLSCNVALAAGLNTIIVQASDAAGNSTAISIPVIFTATVLSINASSSPAANAAGWNNTNVTVTFTCTGGTGTVTCPQPVVVATEGANQTISRTATDSAGNTAVASVTLRIDKTPPTVAISSPASSATVTTPQITVTGTALDTLSGVANVTCNGAPAILTLPNFTCTATLALGANSVAVTAADIAGNVSPSTLALTYAPPATITLTAPANLSYLNINPTTVNGTVNDSTATVTVNGLAAPVGNGSFSVAVPLAEGPNIITATATTPAGTASTASIQVTLDTTPPHVTITTPPDKFVTTDASISVAGNVNDIVVGTVNDQQAQVTINGNVAQVANRTFLASNVALNVGSNTIQAVARDRAGNAATTQITVTRQPPSQSQQIKLISGNNQTGAISSPLTAPLVVALADTVGNPVPDKPVIFKVTQNNGMLSGGGAPAPSLVANTNAQGQAQVQWTLGARSGAGGNVVEAYSVGFDGTAIFTATGTQGPAGIIVIDSGNNQIGAINQPLPKPLIAVVVDGGNNRLPNVPMTFTVKQGGGSFGGQLTVTSTTDSDGRAAATLTLGFQEGNSNNLIEANFPSNLGFPASFTASGRAQGDPTKTTISGVVLDNSNVPIPGVTIRAVLTNVLTSNSSSVQSAALAQTDAKGQFTISQAPIGFVKLLVDGSTATLPGTYPTLDYDLVTVAGQNNSVGMPIYLLPIKTNNQLCVTATTGGGTLTIPEAPGFSLTFGPGQVTFPGGSKTGCVSVTVVHPDKVPMTPGFGQQPRFIVTVQPSGALFNPPAPITLPNVDGLAPRAVTEMYSFDHDIGSFVAIGTGVVSDDGQVIRSSQGVGVLKAGWHCGGNPNALGTVANCSDCNYCQGSTPQSATCVLDPQRIGAPCASPDQCYFGQCGAGSFGPPAIGACVNLVPKDCDDHDICTDDSCLNGQCNNLRKSPAQLASINAAPADANQCPQRACRTSGYTPTVNGCGSPSSVTGILVPNCLNGIGPAFLAFILSHFGASCPAAARNAPLPICFTVGCNIHDQCYGTCDDGLPNHKNQCDSNLQSNLIQICEAIARPQGVYNECVQCAAAYFQMVSAFGDGPYKQGQAESRLCCP